MTTTSDRPTASGSTPASSDKVSIRDRWNSLPRPQQWAWLIPVVVLIYALPLLNPPLLTTEPGTNFPLALFDAARFALIAIGLNVVVGQAGLLDLGYVGFFAIGSYVAAC